jgi:hypothetical protein
LTRRLRSHQIAAWDPRERQAVTTTASLDSGAGNPRALHLMLAGGAAVRR